MFNRNFIPALLVLLLLGLTASAQRQAVLKGRIVDKDKQPVIGATVAEKGTTNGMVSGMDGEFELTPSGPDALVTFSFLGFKTQEMKASEIESPLEVVLESDAVNMDDVVVVGYGTMKKKDATGSVVSLDAEQLNRGAVTSPQELLQGKISGVHVTPGDGGPGSSASIRIRGQASLMASNDPLVVIDGIPVSGSSAPGMPNALATVNPNDIETFTVLKDASATAIYGSRASNGVIIITTKKGAGKLKVEYNSTYSVRTNSGQVETLGADEFRRYMAERYPAGTTNGDKVQSLLGENSTDWQKAIFRPAFGTDQSLSVQGSAFANRLPYRVSLGYTNEDGTLKTSNFQRYTADVSLAPKFLKNHLSLNVNLKGMKNKNRFADAGAVGAAAFFDPTQPIYRQYPDGRFNGYFTWVDSEGLPNSQGPVNPLALLYDVNNTSDVTRALGNVQVDYRFHFLPDLRANLNLGFDITQSHGINGPKANSVQAWRDTDYRGEGRYSDWEAFRGNRLLDFYLNYNKYLGKHHVDLMAGYSWQHFYLSDHSKSITNTTQKLHMEDWNKRENYLLSFFGRANYTFDSRYMATFTLRNDASSRFSEKTRWGLFPSVALAWNIAEEGFLKGVTPLSVLKLRLGWGETGQQDLGEDNYPYMSRYNLSDVYVRYKLGDQYYQLLKPEAYDENIKWETTTTYNAGLDFGLLNNRITGSVDAYYRETRDMLNNIPVPVGSNFSNYITTNVGNMRNKGIELSLNGLVVSTKNFSWNLGFNGTWQNTKITKLTAAGSSKGTEIGGISGGKGNMIQIHQVGYAPYTFYAYQQVYDQNGRPVQNAFVDQDGDGVITNADRVITDKSPNPDFFYGINSQFKYRNWDLGFNLRGSVGNYMFNDFAAGNSTPANLSVSKGFLVNLAKVATQTGFTDVNQVRQYQSDMFIENASFLKMDNITLGYTAPNLFKSGLSMRVFASVQNVFTITKYSGLDPEGWGIDNNIWPRPRVFTLGLNLNF